jgi:hypothetical protein
MKLQDSPALIPRLKPRILRDEAGFPLLRAYPTIVMKSRVLRDEE